MMLREFTRHDSNNDRALDLNEFAGFGAIVFDAVSFFRKSSKVRVFLKKMILKKKFIQALWLSLPDLNKKMASPKYAIKIGH